MIVMNELMAGYDRQPVTRPLSGVIERGSMILKILNRSNFGKLMLLVGGLIVVPVLVIPFYPQDRVFACILGGWNSFQFSPSLVFSSEVLKKYAQRIENAFFAFHFDGLLYHWDKCGANDPYQRPCKQCKSL